MSYSTKNIPDSDKTPWQDGNPPCPGLWEREFRVGGLHPVLAYWDGRQWAEADHWALDTGMAMRYTARLSGVTGARRWRGLNFDPTVGRGS